MFGSPRRFETMGKVMGGGPEDVRHRYEAVQAISFADRIKQPVLLVYGANDLVAPWDQGYWMQQASERAGNDKVVFETIPGVGHYFEQMTLGYKFDETAAVVVDWLDKTL